ARISFHSARPLSWPSCFARSRIESHSFSAASMICLAFSWACATTSRASRVASYTSRFRTLGDGRGIFSETSSGLRILSFMLMFGPQQPPLAQIRWQIVQADSTQILDTFADGRVFFRSQFRPPLQQGWLRQIFQFCHQLRGLRL